MAYAPTFQQAIEMVEALPRTQQDQLLEIVRRRHIEKRRDEIAQDIAAARAEFGRGEIVRGSVDDLMSELGDETAGLE